MKPKGPSEREIEDACDGLLTLDGWRWKIPLTKGWSALVDEDDFTALSKFKWCVAVNTTKTIAYAMRTALPERKTVLMHRAILAGISAVDHREHLPMATKLIDNRRSNLRSYVGGENQANMRKGCAATSSRFKGVHWSTVDKRWKAEIRGKRFRRVVAVKDEADAAQIYNFMAEEIWGERALLNRA